MKPETRHPARAGLFFAAALVLIVATVLAAAILFRPSFRVWPAPDAGVAPMTFAPFSGAGLISLLLVGALMLLFGMFALLLVLVLCSCGCKGHGGPSLPLPPLPDGRRLADVLRAVAAALRAMATQLEHTNGTIDQVREKLSEINELTVPVPKFRSIGQITILGFQGEAWVPDGTEQRPLFENRLKAQIERIEDDAPGKDALVNAAYKLREHAAVLEQIASSIPA